MSHRDSVFVFAVLVFVCASLLYLDWRRQGDVDNLHARVDLLERRLRDVTVSPRATVERILHASDDRTLADIAKEGA